LEEAWAAGADKDAAAATTTVRATAVNFLPPFEDPEQW
jgi:hypothetical protein